MIVFAICLASITAGVVLGVWWRGRSGDPTLGDLADQLTDLRSFMASTTERIQAALDVIKGAAANIVTDLAALKAKIAAGAPTEEVLADLEATAANVQAIADSTPDEN